MGGKLEPRSTQKGIEKRCKKEEHLGAVLGLSAALWGTPTRQQRPEPSRQGEGRERVNPLPGLEDWRIGGTEPRARPLHAQRPEASADS